MSDPAVLFALLAGLVGGACLLALLRRKDPHADASVLRAERERLATELQGEREAARSQATEHGRLNGRLGALETELSARIEEIARLERNASEQQQRREQDSARERLAATAHAESEAALAQFKLHCAALELDVAATGTVVAVEVDPAIVELHRDRVGHQRIGDHGRVSTLVPVAVARRHP